MSAKRSDARALYRMLFPPGPGAKDPGDIKTRLELIERLDESIFVTAGAGSGKTACMSARLVALIAAGDASCADIAAVTFTRKAAAEMRERFQGYIEILAAKGTAEQRERAARAVSEIDSAFIGTIHSFCARMLRERPVEADLAPDFREIEEDEDRLLTERNWREFCAAFPDGSVEAEIARDLFERAIGLTEIESVFKIVCRFPEIVFALPEAKPGGVRGVVKEATTLAGEVIAIVRETALGAAYLREIGSEENILAISERIEAARGYLERRPHVLAGMLRSVREAAFFEDSKGREFDPVKNRGSVKKDPNKRTTEGMERIEENFARWRELLKPGAAGDRFIADVFAWRYAPAIRAANAAAQRYAAYRRENGLCNFADLLLATRNLLRDNPEVRAEMSARHPRVLVDEFQDTDPLQAEIVMYLCADDPAAGSKGRFDGRILRPGALVVVGDPKQSIYRFRRADIEVFAAMKAVFERSRGARVLALTANFRCVPEVAGFVNEVSEGLFSETPGRPVFQAPFEPMLAFRKGGGPASGVMTLTTAGPLNRKEPLIAQEAARMAQFIAAAVRGKTGLGEASWSDFLIVTRQKKRLAVYVEALCAAGIPVEATGAGDLGRSVAHQALSQACSAIADPDNPVHLAAVLRGPLCGASDKELMEWAGSGGAFSLYRSAPAGVPRETAGRFERLFEKLRSLRAAARALPPAPAVEAVVETLGLRRLALASVTPSQALGGIEKTLEKVRTASAAGGLSFEDAARLVAGIGGGGDAMSMEPGRADAVRVMNLHQVKGLEARVVFLAAPSEAEREHSPDVVIARESGAGFAAVRVPRGEHQQADIALPPGWEEMAAREEAQLSAEEDRLRYVAMTRAKDLLVVSVFRNEKGELGTSYGWKPLADRVDSGGFREIPVPDVRYPETDEKINVDGFDLAQKRLADAARTERKVMIISELEGKAAGGGGERLGPEFGTAMHAVLQAMLDRGAAPTAELAKNALTEALDADPDPALVATLVEQANAVAKTALWGRAKTAGRRFTEVPMGAPSQDGRATHFGRADLLFREVGKKGWVLVDFKTGDPEGGRAAALKRTYRPQLDEYARIWEGVTGERVAERYVLFTKTAEAIEM